MTRDTAPTTPTRDTALAAAREHFDSGAFLRDLASDGAISSAR